MAIKVLACALLLAAAVRLFVVLNIPMTFLPNFVHDDGLFMRLAMGHWHYTQFTLMKGPGYPVFLAITAFSGLPVSASHANFQIVAISVAAWAAFRLTNSLALAVTVFVLLAFHPVGLLPDLQRIVRDQIYWAQTLLVFSFFAVLSFARPENRGGTLLNCLAGLTLGWTWLTREEGLWLLPGLALMPLGAAVISHGNKAELIALVRNVGMACGVFAATVTAYMTINLIAYGSFVGVDVKERNFKAALNALEDVEVGPAIPYVAISKAARAEVDKVSPTFRPLDAALSTKPLSGWEVHGCTAYPHTCGELAAGWFLWALRDAAAANGFYESPAIASRNFGMIADEIQTACADGRLTCRYRWLDYLPATSMEQWAKLPATIAAIAGKVAFLNPPDPNITPPSSARNVKFERYWTYLNKPLVAPSEDPHQGLTRAGAGASQALAAKLRWQLVQVYRVIVPPLLLAGVIALLAASAGAISSSSLTPLLVVAWSAWVLVGTRILLLAMLDISSMPAAHYLYAAPAVYLAPLAALYSLAAAVFARAARKFPASPQPEHLQ